MRKLYLVYLIITVLIALLIYNIFSFLNIHTANKRSLSGMRQTYDVMESAKEILDNFKDLETGQIGYIISEKKEYLDLYNHSLNNLRENTNRFNKIATGYNFYTGDKADLQKLNVAIEKKITLTEQSLKVRKNSPENIQIVLNELNNKDDIILIKKILIRIYDTEKNKITKSNLAMNNQQIETKNSIILFNSVAIILIILLLFNIRFNQQNLNELVSNIDRKKSIAERQKNDLQKLSQELINQNAELENVLHLLSKEVDFPLKKVNKNILKILNKEKEITELITVHQDIEKIQHKLENYMHEVNEYKNHHDVKEEINLKTCLDNVLRDLSLDILETKARIRSDFSAWHTIHFSVFFMENILRNILSNAIKFRHPERELKIILTTGFSDNGKVLFITDNGLGMDIHPDEENYFGSHQTILHDDENPKGIGLYLTKAQVIAMGGEIHVESVATQGTTIKIFFQGT